MQAYTALRLALSGKLDEQSLHYLWPNTMFDFGLATLSFDARRAFFDGKSSKRVLKPKTPPRAVAFCHRCHQLNVNRVHLITRIHF